MDISPDVHKIHQKNFEQKTQQNHLRQAVISPKSSTTPVSRPDRSPPAAAAMFYVAGTRALMALRTSIAATLQSLSRNLSGNVSGQIAAELTLRYGAELTAEAFPRVKAIIINRATIEG